MNVENGIAPPAASMAARMSSRRPADGHQRPSGAGEVLEVGEAHHEAGQHAEHDHAGRP